MGGNKVSTVAGGVVGGAVGGILIDKSASSAVVLAEGLKGSIFGIKTAVSTIFGLSTTTESVVTGISCASWGGAAVIIVCMLAGAGLAYSVYTVLNKKDSKVRQASSDQRFNEENY